MNNEAQKRHDEIAAKSRQLKQDIQTQESALKRSQDALTVLQNKCHHEWVVKYDPIVVKGYYDEGDPPGTMGVDRRLPGYVSGYETKQWTRTCKHCGKSKTTQWTKKQSIAGPVPGTSGQVDVPDFGD